MLHRFTDKLAFLLSVLECSSVVKSYFLGKAACRGNIYPEWAPDQRGFLRMCFPALSTILRVNPRQELFMQGFTVLCGFAVYQCPCRRDAACCVSTASGQGMLPV